MITAACARSGAIFLFLLLQACGGDDDSSTRLTLSKDTVSVSATPGDQSPTDELTFTISNPPENQLFIHVDNSENGILRTDLFLTSLGQGTLSIQFKPPGSLTNGTYTDAIELRVCPDFACTTEIKGSPQTVNVTYVVSGEGTTTVTIESTSLGVTADQNETSSRRDTTELTLNKLPPSGVFILADESTDTIHLVSSSTVTDRRRELEVLFAPGSEFDPGTYNDSIDVRVCYDPSCVRQLGGSPFVIETTFNVTVGIEYGVPPLEIQSRLPLGHDVIDAEFSKALNQIVMVGSYPANALYVYDVASGIERQQMLIKEPTSVSIGPDGLTAAVGHDALVSVIDLASVGTPGAPAPIILDVSAPVIDLVLDGAGYVHDIPASEEAVTPFIHSVEIATNTERLSDTFSFARRARLDASGNRLYVADNFSPSTLNSWDVTSGAATSPTRWHNASQYDTCLNLWLNEGGDTIYTACGRFFRASSDPREDMRIVGRLRLSGTSTIGTLGILSLSHSAASNEIALVEGYLFGCDPFSPGDSCFTRLAYYEHGSVNSRAIYAIGPVTIDQVDYAQLGKFVFHDAVGNQKYLIGKIEEAPGPDSEYWLSVVP